MTIPTPPSLPNLTGDSDPVVCAAYRDACTLIDAGWQLQKLRFVAATGIGVVQACTPTHRGVTVTSADRGRRHLTLPNSHYTVRLARSVAILGARGDDSLTDLTWQLSDQLANIKTRPTFGHAHIPDPGLHHQPVSLRRAYWLLVVLVCDYRWRLHCLGEDVAGGGFIAEIPDDLTTIYPAGAAPDGTPATALARLLPQLDAPALHYLRRFSPMRLERSRAIAIRSRWGRR